MKVTGKHSISEAKVICDYFRITRPERIGEIESLIDQLEKKGDCFCSIISFYTRSLAYVSSSFEQITGYKIENTTPNGFDFLLSIIEKSFYPYIMMKQTEYIKEINNPKFEYRKPSAMEFGFDLMHKSGNVFPVRLIIVILEYEPGGDMRTIFVVWIPTNELSKEAWSDKKALVWNELTDLHRLLFSPGSLPKQKRDVSNPLTRGKKPILNPPKLSFREQQLLLLLAKGQSLKEGAKSMKIGYTTAETYRKNLFKKFESKSAAELIRKASKVYWLE